MSNRQKVLAFIDESGHRSPSRKSSDYFVMSAVLMQDVHRPVAEQKLNELKRGTNRKPEHILHFTKLSDQQRSYVAKTIGEFQTLRTISVVACKRVLADRAVMNVPLPEGRSVQLPRYEPLSEDEAYLKSYQYLLERVSWLANSVNGVADVSIEHTQRFKKSTLREFERRMKEDPRCSVEWNAIQGEAKLQGKKNEEMLQFADLTASAVGAAFNGHPVRGTDTSYVHHLKPIIWRGRNGSKPTTYGLKMHPWDNTVRSMHPWIEQF